MKDNRFTTVAGYPDDLFDALDLDDISDIETFLIILFNRPISVEPLEGVDDDDGSLEVTVWVGDTGFTTGCAFPMTVVDLTRSCASAIAELGSAGGGGDPVNDQPSVVAMSDTDLNIALQRALGQVRLFNILDANE